MAVNRAGFALAEVLIDAQKVVYGEWTYTEEDAARLQERAVDPEEYSSYFLGVDESGALTDPIGKYNTAGFWLYEGALTDAKANEELTDTVVALQRAIPPVEEVPNYNPPEEIQAGDGEGTPEGGLGGGPKDNPSDPGVTSADENLVAVRAAIVGKRFNMQSALRRDQVNEDTRTVQLSFSSEEPVLREFGYEVLEHSKDRADFSRLEDNAPLLKDHDWTQQIGVVEKVWLDGKKGRASVRFAKDDEGEKEYQRVLDGIRTKVSVGYEITDVTDTNETREELPVYRVAFKPYEISTVSIPADLSVGVGRSDIAEGNEVKDTKKTGENVSDVTPTVDSVNERAEEKERINELLELGSRFNQSELAREYINSDKSVNEFRTQILETIGEHETMIDNTKDTNVGMNEKEARSYSIIKAVRAHLSHDWSEAGLERECNEALSERFGTPRGFYLPQEAMGFRAEATTALGGAGLVNTSHLGDSFIEYLYANSVLVQAGAKVMDGLVGNIQIPRQDGKSDAHWVAESGDVTVDGSFSTTTVTLAPKTVGAYVPITRTMLKSGAPSIDQVVYNDLMSSLTGALDKAFFQYSLNAPTCISGMHGAIASNTGLGTAITWAHVVDCEGDVMNENADKNNLAYVTDGKTVASLKTIEKASGAGFCMTDALPRLLNGYPVYVTSNQTHGGQGLSTGRSQLTFGDWSQVIIGLFGPVDIYPDAGGNADGTIAMRGFLEADLALRQPKAFANKYQITH